MQASDKIKKFIGSQEGCRLVAYKPLSTDRWTIGYGITYYTPQEPVQQGDTIDQDYADSLLSIHVDSVASLLNHQPIPHTVTQNQFDAVVSLVYNIGYGAFSASTTGRLFYSGQDISDRFAAWNKSGGQPVKGLTLRREREREIYVNSNYNN